MIKRLFAILCLCTSAWATTTVTGNIKNLGASTVSAGTFIRFYLRGCAGNQPRVIGSGLIAPTLGNVFYVDVVPNAAGTISGSIYSNRDVTGNNGGEIDCGGITTGTWYGLVPFLNGKSGPETPFIARNTATVDISTVTPLTANPVVVSPTGDTTYLRLDGGNSPMTAAISGPFAVNGAITAQSYQGTVELDHYADMAAAVAALPSGGTVHVPCGTYTLPTSAVAINVNGIHIRGEGFCSNLQITSTNDNFAITAAVFQVYGVQLTVTTASSRNGKAIFHSTSSGGSQLRFESIRWTPAVGPDSGSFYIADVNATSQISFRNISTPGGSTQPITSFIKVASGGPSSVSVISLDNIWGAATCTDACIVLDGFIDTFKMNDVLWSQVGGTCLGPQFWARNTVGSGTDPRWIFSNNVQFECPGGTAIKLDNSREFQYINSYVATAATGIAIGANAVETKIAHSMLTNIATNGITGAATAKDTLIIGSTFTDCGNNADNATDCISLAATMSRFNIDFNHFRLTGANRSRNSIFVAAGGSTDLDIFGNDGTGAFGTLFISNGATGANQHVLGNVPLQPVGTEVLTNPLKLNSSLTTNSTIQTGGGAFIIDSASNKVTVYNSVNTAGIGVVPVYKATSQKAETQAADANVLTYTPPAAVGNYRVCFEADVSSATSGVIGWTLGWTDSNANAHVAGAMSLFQAGTAVPALTFTTSAATNYDSCHTIQINNAAANIVVGWVGGGTTVAKVSATVEQLQ